MMESWIALRNVTFGYDAGRQVLNDVSLDIGPGDRIALAGRNGAGKSTLLQLLVGLRHPRSGHVEAFGRMCRTEHDFLAVRRRVALLFQDSEDQLFCPTVIEDVAFGPLNLHHPPPEARRLALAALEQVGLPAHADRITHHLSAGEKKLVALATLLSMKPRILLLDEPTAGLDEAAVERVADILAGLDAAQLIVSQDAAFLRRTARRHLQLVDGMINDQI